MIQNTTKLLSQLHHLMLNERERDDATLPLDLWKTPVRYHYLITMALCQASTNKNAKLLLE
jgi:hypothetical protein